MLVGTVGIVVPVLPGLIVVWAATLVWALERQDGPGWVVFGLATLVYAVGLVAKYVVPGRRMRTAGVDGVVVAVALVVAVVGFFVVPVVGAPLGFVLDDLRPRAGQAPGARTGLARDDAGHPRGGPQHRASSSRRRSPSSRPGRSGSTSPDPERSRPATHAPDAVLTRRRTPTVSVRVLCASRCAPCQRRVTTGRGGASPSAPRGAP